MSRFRFSIRVAPRPYDGDAQWAKATPVVVTGGSRSEAVDKAFSLMAELSSGWRWVASVNSIEEIEEAPLAVADDGIVDAEIHCPGCQCPPHPCPRCGRTDVLSASHLVDCPAPPTDRSWLNPLPGEDG